jgi:hypothetical protein
VIYIFLQRAQSDTLAAHKTSIRSVLATATVPRKRWHCGTAVFCGCLIILPAICGPPTPTWCSTARAPPLELGCLVVVCPAGSQRCAARQIKLHFFEDQQTASRFIYFFAKSTIRHARHHKTSIRSAFLRTRPSQQENAWYLWHIGFRALLRLFLLICKGPPTNNLRIRARYR